MDSGQCMQPERQIKKLLWIVIVGLMLSGITAFPLETELSLAVSLLDSVGMNNTVFGWITLVHSGVVDTYSKFPFVAYGTDWLAFAHLVFAVLFIGPLKDPVKNIWVIEFGIISSVAIVPFAIVAGYFRGIPFFWQLIDCSFGIICGTLLLICRFRIKQMELLCNNFP